MRYIRLGLRVVASLLLVSLVTSLYVNVPVKFTAPTHKPEGGICLFEKVVVIRVINNKSDDAMLFVYICLLHFNVNICCKVYVVLGNVRWFYIAGIKRDVINCLVLLSTFTQNI